jgi:hypothetical protein
MKTLQVTLLLFGVVGAILVDKSITIKTGMDEDLRSRANLYQRDDLIIPSQTERNNVLHGLGWLIIIGSTLAQAYLVWIAN